MINKHLQKYVPLLLLIVIGITNIEVCRGQHFKVSNFSTNDGLPQPYVYTINQDTEGNLWIGSGNGLVKYNGYGFATYTQSDSLADNFITTSIQFKGNVWFGHMNGWVTRLSERKFAAIKLSPEIQSAITDMKIGYDGNLWIATFSEGLWRINDDLSIERIEIIAEKTPHISSFSFFNESELLIGNEEGAYILTKVNKHTFTLNDRLQSVPQSKIVAIRSYVNSSQHIVATQHQGIFWVDKKTKKQPKVNAITNHNEHLFRNVQQILIDSDTNLWVATFGSGVYKLKKNNSNHYQIKEQFSPESFPFIKNTKYIFQDREGIIWCGNYGGGLSKITQQIYTYTEFDKQVYGNNIFSLFIDNDFRWVATDKCLLKLEHESGNLLAAYNTANGLPNDQISCIYNKDGTLWIGTKRKGVFLFDTKKEQAQGFFISNGILENSITSITGNRTDIWIGTKKGVCHIKNDSVYRWITIQSMGLPHNSVNDVFYSSNRKIWITTQSNTLVFIANDSIGKVLIKSPRKNFTLNTLEEDEKGRIWVASLGGGVFLIEDGNFISISEFDGLLNDYCYSLTSDGKNGIWIGHKGGISRINTDDYHVRSNQQKHDEFHEFDFNAHAAEVDRDGKVWLGSNFGIVAINTSIDGKNTHPPILTITDVKINNKPIDLKGKIKLKAGNYKFDFSYLGTSLSEPHLTKYQYLLKGYDAFPTITKSTNISYNGVSDGKYRFIVKAINSDGIESEKQAEIKIIIQSPLWKKVWLYLLIFSLTTGVILLNNRRIKLRNLQEKKRLEEKVKERTLEILRQKNQLKKTNIQIKEKNKNITDSIKYAGCIQSAILPPDDQINGLLPQNFIIYKPRDIVSGDFYWINNQEDNVLFAIGDCTGHGVPGAFMSILGITLLNEIVMDSGIISPKEILTRLRCNVIRSLRQGFPDSSSHDTIDMAICNYNQKTNELYYAGALLNLIHFSGQEMKLYKADRFPLGYSHHNEIKFTNHKISIKKGDMVYIYTDGFQDQFGGGMNKKYTSRRLNKILHKYHTLEICEQRSKILKALLNWMGLNEQTDDILLLGVRF